MGVPFLLNNGITYEVTGGSGSVILQTNGLQPTDITIPTGCMNFGQPLNFSISSFAGLCNYSIEVRNSFSNNTYTTTNGSITMPDDGWCTPPPGGQFVGKRCMQTQVTLKVQPCEGQNCPPIEVSRDITICCFCDAGGSSGKRDISTGLNEENEKQHVRIYPNPANSIINVVTQPGSVITIYSVDGKLKQYIKSTQHDSQLDISELTPGTYFVIVQNNEQVIATEKLNVIK